MNKEVLDKALRLDEEIQNIREILMGEPLCIWNGVYRQHVGPKYYTTKEIDTKLRKILTNVLERKEKEFAEL